MMEMRDKLCMPSGVSVGVGRCRWKTRWWGWFGESATEERDNALLLGTHGERLN